MTIERTVNYKLCRACKGKNCCAVHGGLYRPSDFSDLSKKSIKKLLDNGTVSISSCAFIDDPSKIYLYLCVPEIGKGAIDLFSLPAPCSFWSPETGCKFKRVDKRPWGCAVMQPNKKGNECVQHYTVEQLLKDWYPYQKKLTQVVQELTHKSVRFNIAKAAEEAYPQLRNILLLHSNLTQSLEIPNKYISSYLYLKALGYKF